MSEQLYAVYRRLDREGNGEDWAIRSRHDRIEVRHGPTDAETSRFAVPARLCKDNTPWKEAGLHVDARLDEGFVKIGTGRFPDERLELAVRDDKAGLSLHWEAPRPVDGQTLCDVLYRIKERLRRNGVAAIHSEGGLSRHASMAVMVPTGVWKVGQLADGRIGQHDRGGIARIDEADGTAAILVLMKIERELPGTVRFTWREPDDAQAVTPRIRETDFWLGAHVGPYGETLRVAHALGLTPTPGLLSTKEWAIGGEDDPPPLWF